MSETHFKVGQEVEVTTQEEGFRGSWYVADVLRISMRRKKMFIEYHTLMDEKNVKKKLKEDVDFWRVRPQPPPLVETNRGFKVNDEVDVFDNDG
ncbi:hypothetical protein GIB67_006866 [Kingdonia uniflora]|uniref:Agenet domain-containing protein n=1 Tax=Kingdonia uniflora TaxID=39325 RepID=A0A7J7L0B8_9MAGN|nr:hypothetical protein GIB67_006866 [Kingdonia uniflora]